MTHCPFKSGKVSSVELSLFTGGERGGPILQVRPHHGGVQANVRGPAHVQGVVLGPATGQPHLYRYRRTLFNTANAEVSYTFRKEIKCSGKTEILHVLVHETTRITVAHDFPIFA